jgi:Acetyltransferase (GNAT) domain
MPNIVQPVRESEWEELAALCESATFFHTPAWANIVCEANPGYEVATWATRLANGTRLIFPLVSTWRESRSGARGYESTPLFAYGGPICDGPVDQADLGRVLEDALHSQKLQGYSMRLIGNPHFQLTLGKPFASRAGSTQVIDLRSGLETIRSRYNKMQKRAVKTAERARVTIRAASTLKDWETYYSLYQESVTRWGESATSSHPWRLFDAMHRHQNDAVRLWLAEVDGEACAGAIVLYARSIACYWHGASTERHAKQMGSKLLHDRIIEDACARGLRTYDLLSSGNHEGVARFKASLGATSIEFAHYDWRCPSLSRLSFFVKRRFHSLWPGNAGART